MSVSIRKKDIYFSVFYPSLENTRDWAELSVKIRRQQLPTTKHLDVSLKALWREPSESSKQNAVAENFDLVITG